jgi:hypothetical protein
MEETNKLVTALSLADHKREIELLYNSSQYHELERQLSANNARFENLPASTKLLATYLHQKDLLSELEDGWTLFYKRPVPKIQDYLSAEYIGGMDAILFETWRRELTEFFSPGSAKYELVLGGAIGCGKSSCGLVAKSYNFFKINSLLHPQQTLNVAPNTTLVAALFSVTLDKASLAIIEPFKALLLDGNFYVEAKKTEWQEAQEAGKIPFYQRDGTLYFPNNIIVNIGSNVSHFYGAELNTLFVIALLTIMAVTISDKIVVFDRIRENLKGAKGAAFSDTVGKSLSQTFGRSINTSLTVILALLALFFFGPETTKNFSLVLIVGMFFGTYSSIFVASPLLVIVEAWQRKHGKK